MLLKSMSGGIHGNRLSGFFLQLSDGRACSNFILNEDLALARALIGRATCAFAGAANQLLGVRLR